MDAATHRRYSERMVERLRANRVPHVYRLYECEGHGFRKAETLVDYYQTAERFLREQVILRGSGEERVHGLGENKGRLCTLRPARAANNGDLRSKPLAGPYRRLCTEDTSENKSSSHGTLRAGCALKRPARALRSNHF